MPPSPFAPPPDPTTPPVDQDAEEDGLSGEVEELIAPGAFPAQLATDLMVDGAALPAPGPASSPASAPGPSPDETATIPAGQPADIEPAPALAPEGLESVPTPGARVTDNAPLTSIAPEAALPLAPEALAADSASALGPALMPAVPAARPFGPPQMPSPGDEAVGAMEAPAIRFEAIESPQELAEEDAPWPNEPGSPSAPSPNAKSASPVDKLSASPKGMAALQRGSSNVEGPPSSGPAGRSRSGYSRRSGKSPRKVRSRPRTRSRNMYDADEVK